MKSITKQITLGSRSSRLAKIQVQEIISSLKEKGELFEYEYKTYFTQGDKDQGAVLAEHMNDDFFTDTLDTALINGEVDATIHSAKDLPSNINAKLRIAAITESLDDTDSLVGSSALSELKPGSRIGTSSELRKKEILKRYAHLKALPIRGNIDERMSQLREGKYDAIIVATCALKRLGLESDICEILPWQATQRQGQLAVLVRAEDKETQSIFSVLDTRTEQEKKIVLYLGTNPQKYQHIAQLIHHPMIQISEADVSEKDKEKIWTCAQNYHMIIFTSRFAVKYFFKVLEEKDISIQTLKNTIFSVIGEDTAWALRHCGLDPQITAKTESGIGLLEELQKGYDLKGKKILFPRSSLPNPYLKDELIKRGSDVEEISIYQNIKPEVKALPEQTIDCIYFTSPSTVHNFLEDYKEIPRQWQILCKGSKTQKSLQDAGYDSQILELS